MIYFFFALALLVGLSLGLTGSGGAILTLPILIYGFKFDVQQATSYSLFIIGVSASVGSLQSLYNKAAHLKTALLIALPSLIMVYIARQTILPMLPNEFELINKTIKLEYALMIVFALLMLASGYSMANGKCVHCDNDDILKIKFNYPLILALGVLIGLITGILGAGGGFLITPALVLFVKLPLRLSMGTSLIVVSLNSFFGFGSDILNNIHPDWIFLLKFSGIVIIGLIMGMKVAKKLDTLKLKKIFGWFVFSMGITIMSTEIYRIITL